MGSFTSAVYEERLEPENRTSKRQIGIPDTCKGHLAKSTGIVYVPVEHDGNTQGSDEEAAVIGSLIEELLKCTFVEDGIERALTYKDILVVAPYNMQVRALKSKHHNEYVGTVDIFQGQEAPVVIISMCASDGNESARGLEFLFNKNRLNVAISRAKCLAIVIGSPRLARTACTRVEQMQLINLFCRIVEVGSDQGYPQGPEDAKTVSVMTDSAAKLEQAIQQAASQYFRLVVVAGEPASGKTATLESIAQHFGCQVINVNLELSKRMLELSRTQRSRQVERLLKEVIAAAQSELVLLDNLEILFDTSLEVEPLRLLQVCSRNHILVASWNGSYHSGTLTYAEPGHPEFIQFKKTEAVVISVGASAQHTKESISR